MSTFASDRAFFLRRLRSDPVFLLRHIPALIAAISGRLGTRLRSAAQPRHLGPKRWPNGILVARNIFCAPVSIEQFVGSLPKYDVARVRLLRLSENIESPLKRQDDAEDYLAEHRWDFLSRAAIEVRRPLDAELSRMQEWIASAPDTSDDAWETYSTCERVANSLVLFASLSSSGAASIIPPSYIPFLCRSLEWIYHHLEYYGARRTNNHILNNARALVMGGVAIGDRAAVDAGMRLFRAYLPRMVLAGGHLRERSSHYQLVVLGWILDAAKFLSALPDPLTEDVALLRDYGRRMSGAAAMFVSPDGALQALIGDVSPDCTPAETAARLSALYADHWPSADRDLAPCGVSDGWFKLTASESVVIGNVGDRIFPPRFPTHGHADHTSFAWLVNGTTILTDPGRFRYTSDDTSLDQRSAQTHNLPVIDGFSPLCESLLPLGAWWPLPYASASIDAACTRDGLEISHDGYARATRVRRHVRALGTRGWVLIVTDEFQGEGGIDVAFVWHFSQTMRSFDAAALRAKGSEYEVQIAIDSDAGPVTPASSKSSHFWESRSYGRRVPSLLVCLGMPLTLPARIRTTFTAVSCAE